MKGDASQTTRWREGSRIDFPTGHGIHVHFVSNGYVHYQVWPPGVEEQTLFDRAYRMTIEEFDAEVEERGGKEAVYVEA
jgi:hypothetical protein